MPRTASSPRSGLSNIPSAGEYTPGLSGSGDDSKQRSLRKKYTVVNGTPTTTTPSTTITSSIDQQQVSRSVLSRCVLFVTRETAGIDSSRKEKREKKKNGMYHPFIRDVPLSLPRFLLLRTRSLSLYYTFVASCVYQQMEDGNSLSLSLVNGNRTISRPRRRYSPESATL